MAALRAIIIQLALVMSALLACCELLGDELLEGEQLGSEQQGDEPQRQNWQLKADKKGVQVFTRSVAGSPYKEVRGIMQLEGVKLSSMVALVLDTGACSEWADQCKDSYVYRQLSPTESYVYTLNDLPWPVTDRDVLAYVIWRQNPITLEVTMHSVATEGILAAKPGVLRLTQARASWTFTPMGKDRIRVISEAHINPGSPLPGWVTNMLLVDSPLKTMAKMAIMVRNKKYQSARIDFIRNP